MALSLPLPFPTKRESTLEVVPGRESPSGLLELHWTDADGSPRFIILPERAQHELLDALLRERGADIIAGRDQWSVSP